MVALGEATAIVVEVPPPTFAERRSAWAAASGIDEVDDVAAKFRLSIGQIAEAADVAKLAAATRGEDAPKRTDLDLGARRASSTRLAELASRLDAPFGWDDLVIPDRQLEVLHSISAYLRHRDLVLSEWGYERTVARNQGIKVLFAGESGTGKTMAGQVLARDLGLDLFRLDLATVVSKYIGETEKNLDRVFARRRGVERDPLLRRGRRAVRQALGGPRRPRPLREHRGRLPAAEDGGLPGRRDPGDELPPEHGRRVPAPPRRRRRLPVPRARGPRADLAARAARGGADRRRTSTSHFLAERFKLSGGSIRNCSLAAAFMAADAGGEIRMEHLVRAVALEYDKLGRLTIEADFEHFHSLIRPQTGGFPAAG